MRLLKWAAIGLGGLVGVAVVLVAGIWLVSDPAPVPPTVSNDKTLPRRSVDGIALHLTTSGAAEAPPIIVLHGGPGGDHRSLLPLSALSGTHHVLFYDQRGAGLSERVPAERLTLQGYMEELDALASSFDQPVTLIGHSWGAMLAHAYLGAHPEKVASAVLIEPGFLNAAEAAAWQARAKSYMSGPSFLWDALTAGIEAFKLTPVDHDTQKDHIWGQMVHRFANAPGNPYHCKGDPFDSPAWRFGAVASQTASQAPPADFDTLAKGTAYQGPILFMTGACDTWIGAALQRTRLPQYADARLVDIPGAGHDVIDDQPEAALTAIRAFLAAP
ncbi:alpha/beta fold hydrolase [Pseudoprimorskyibacter insulae]|uniref:Proline iminopeptidase n=1 Tax=Pseudoprimorskyibacter insulae TaxID=1695997 RepID=A0A2R8AXQ3_9RHOB|nr:alpha/beta hydrolase [Pseudoprimorskyibacter insulae]SPF80790.1 Proline iminopeptidase [Pseudoprimorskyibacter insulae]